MKKRGFLLALAFMFASMIGFSVTDSAEAAMPPECESCIAVGEASPECQVYATASGWEICRNITVTVNGQELDTCVIDGDLCEPQ